MGQGLLTGKFRTLEDVPMNRRANRMYDSAWGQGVHTDHGFEKEIFSFLDKLRAISENSGISMSAMSFAFLASKEYVGSILFGARTPAQLEENIKAFHTPVDYDILKQIETLSAELRDSMGNNADLWQNAPNAIHKEGRIY